MQQWTQVKNDGTIDVDTSNLNADLSLLTSFDAIKVFFNETLISNNDVGEKIGGFKLNGSGITPQCLAKIIKSISDGSTFPSLETILLMNIKMTEEDIDTISSMIDPRGKRCKWKVLRLYNCGLNTYKMNKLFKALKENVALEEFDVSGNLSSDDPISILVDCLINHENSIRYLGLANNQITDKGLKSICKVLSSSRQHIQTLTLANNPGITSLGLPGFFESLLSYSHSLQELCLSGCSITSCDWCNYLPFLTSLQQLTLSYNQIDDYEVSKLWKCLTFNTSLVRLDLSHNRLTGRDCGPHFQSFLEINQSLQYLSLSSNYFQSSVQLWESVAKGLLQNNVLLELDLSDCLIDLEGFSILSFAYTVNVICEIIVYDNPLSYEIMQSSREYVKSSSSSSTKKWPKQVHLLDKKRERLSEERAIEWRKDQVDKLIMTLKAIAIQQQATTNLLSDYQFLQTIWTPTIVQQSEYYYPASTVLQALVHDLQHCNTQESQIVYIAYGQRSCIVGHLTIQPNVNYLQLRELIKPLLNTYLRTLEHASDQDALTEEFVQFHILDNQGKKIAVEAMRDRLVWKEIYQQSEPNILIKPFHWISLDD